MTRFARAPWLAGAGVPIRLSAVPEALSESYAQYFVEYSALYTVPYGKRMRAAGEENFLN